MPTALPQLELDGLTVAAGFVSQRSVEKMTIVSVDTKLSILNLPKFVSLVRLEVTAVMLVGEQAALHPTLPRNLQHLEVCFHRAYGPRDEGCRPLHGALEHLDNQMKMIDQRP